MVAPPAPARRPWVVLFFIPYLTGGIVWSVLLDTPGSGAFDFTFRYLALPVLAAVVAVVVFGGADSPARVTSRGRRAANVALVYLGLVFCAAPYVLAINSVGAGDETVTLAGPVLDKWRRSGKTTSYSVQILDDRTQRKVRMSVSPADYRAIEVGARFSREYLVGRLGIPYRWTIR